MSESTTLIVGGGMLGLSLAHFLSRQGEKVKVLEAGPILGGLASGWQVGDIQWDKFYHVTLLSDRNLRELLTELDLEAQMQWRVTKTEFYQGGSRYPLNNAVDFLKLPVLNLLDKLRLGLTIVYASRRRFSKNLEALPVADWLQRWSGKRVYKRLWKPLLRAKLGSNDEKVSAAFIWSVIQRFYAARRGGLKTEMFGYVPGSYRTVTTELKKRLEQQGVEILCHAAVSHVERRDGRLCVETASNSHLAHRVIITCDSHKAVGMLPQLRDSLKKQHLALRYQGVVCVSVVLNVPLTGAYLTYITDEHIPFTTVIDMSELVTFSQPDRYLVYLPKYVDANDPILSLPSEDLEKQFVGALLQMYPHIAADNIVSARAARASKVVSLPTLHYSDKMPEIATNIEGVYVFNSAQTRDAALSVESTVSLAKQGAAYFEVHR